MTITAALTHAQQRLANISDAPALDAERLLLHVVEQDETAWLITHGDQPLSPAHAASYQAVVDTRAQGKPLAYIIGSAYFYGRPFAVSPAVLIPRPATEDLVDAALDAIHTLHRQHGRPLTIADIGTGSGCIAITLALETTPEHVAHIYATDISPEALAVAQRNAIVLGVADRLTFRQGSLLEPVTDVAIDLIVSNPPYVPTAEVAQAHYSRDTIGLTYEPILALDGGPDGQQYLQPLIVSGLPLVAETAGGSIQRFNLVA